jgi:hypothetical protein
MVLQGDEEPLMVKVHLDAKPQVTVGEPGRTLQLSCMSWVSTLSVRMWGCSSQCLSRLSSGLHVTACWSQFIGARP